MASQFDLRLSEGLSERLSERPEGAGDALNRDPPVLLRKVRCLNSCPLPCSVALRAPGKWGYRLSGLLVSDIDAVLLLATGRPRPCRFRGPAVLAVRGGVHLPRHVFQRRQSFKH